MRVSNAFIMAHLWSQIHDYTIYLFVATIDSPIQASEYIEHKLNQLGFTRLRTLETMMTVLD